MTEYEIPKRASRDQLLSILKAYYLEGAHNDAVTTSAVENTLGTSDIVGRQTAFLTEIGILEKEGTKRRLTETGEKISEAIMAENDELAKSLFATNLQDWEFVVDITKFVQMRDDGASRDSLAEFLDANASSSDRTGINSLIDILTWSGVLEKAEDGFIVGSSTPANHDIDDPISGEDGKPTTKNDFGGRWADSSNIDISIHLELPQGDSVDDVEKKVAAIRRALENPPKSEDR